MNAPMNTPIFANSALVNAAERLVLRGGQWRQRALWVRYGLYLSAGAGPVLIDTGYTRHALMGAGRSAGLRLYSRVLGAALLPEAQPEAFLAAFGLRPQDITTVIVTHFHADHVSGLSLFPQARFLASTQGWTGVRHRSGFANLRHAVFSELLPPTFADRLDLIESRPAVPTLPLLASSDGAPMGYDLLGDGSVLSMALPGHAEGHVGLIFPQLARPLLYAVDAQWLKAALPAPCRPGFPAMLVATDRVAHARSNDLVCRFAEAGGDVVLCHDPNPTPYDWQHER